MNFWRSLGGIIRAELTSAELCRTMESINSAGITLHRLELENELTCSFDIPRNQYGALQRLVKKRGESLRIRSRIGIFWSIAALKERIVLLVGLLLLFLTVLFLSETILFLRVEGNNAVPDRQILAAAEKAGIGFGIPRRKIRNEPAKNSILTEIPQLQWVGINTSGCTAVIRVQEREDLSAERPYPSASRIIARQDGYIMSVTTSRGTPEVREGQTVRKGQLLISGYTDHGFFIRAGKAEGEILAQTNRQIRSVIPAEHLVKGQYNGKSHRISLIIRKKRINLWKGSGISYTTCGRMYEEYYFILPGGFRLPVALAIETFTHRETVPGIQDESVVKELLQERSRQYLHQQMLSGRIISSQEQFSFDEGLYLLHTRYTCEEELGLEQSEEIGVMNGKND